jgi:hypothetical protein
MPPEGSPIVSLDAFERMLDRSSRHSEGVFRYFSSINPKGSHTVLLGIFSQDYDKALMDLNNLFSELNWSSSSASTKRTVGTFH